MTSTIRLLRRSIARLSCLLFLSGCLWSAPQGSNAADTASGSSISPEFYARYLEAEMALGAADPAQARAALESSLTKDDCPDFIFVAQADALRAQNKLKEAQDTLDSGMKKHPKSIDLMLARAGLDRDAGRVGDAIAGLDKVLELSPHRQDALEMLSDLHLARLIGNPSGSDDDIKALIKVYNTMLETRQGTDRLVPLLVLSTLYQRTGELQKAVDVSGEALKLNHRSSRIYDAHATALASAGRIDEAIKVYADGLIAIPDDDSLSHKVEALLTDHGGEDRIASFYVDLAKSKPDNAAVQQTAAHSLMGIKRWPEAEVCLRRILEKKPDDLSNELALLHVWVEMGRVDEAVGEAKKLGDKGGDLAPVITLSVAEALEGQGKRDQAVDLLQSYVQKHPLNENVTLGLAALLLEDQQKDKAIDLLEMLKSKAPDNFTAISLLAGVYADGERFDDAHKMLATLPEKTLQEHSADVGLIDSGLYVNEAMQRENKKNYDEALGLLDRAQKQLSQVGDLSTDTSRRKALSLKTAVLLSRGEIKEKQGDATAAEAAYRAAVDLNPDDAETWNGMGYYYAVTNQKLDEAEKMVRKALELKPDAPHIVDSLGWVLYRQGRFADAVEQLEKATKAMGDDPGAAEIYSHLGDAYLKADRKSDAVKAWQKAIDLKGDIDAAAIQKRIDEAGK